MATLMIRPSPPSRKSSRVRVGFGMEPVASKRPSVSSSGMIVT